MPDVFYNFCESKSVSNWLTIFTLKLFVLAKISLAAHLTCGKKANKSIIWQIPHFPCNKKSCCRRAEWVSTNANNHYMATAVFSTQFGYLFLAPVAFCWPPPCAFKSNTHKRKRAVCVFLFLCWDVQYALEWLNTHKRNTGRHTAAQTSQKTAHSLTLIEPGNV